MYAVHFGDMVSVYAALSREIDPTPVGLIDQLKHYLTSTDKK
jgi:hypothetical protein